MGEKWLLWSPFTLHAFPFREGTNQQPSVVFCRHCPIALRGTQDLYQWRPLSCCQKMAVMAWSRASFASSQGCPPAVCSFRKYRAWLSMSANRREKDLRGGRVSVCVAPNLSGLLSRTRRRPEREG